MILLTLSRGKGEETVRLQLPASPAEIGETFAFPGQNQPRYHSHRHPGCEQQCTGPLPMPVRCGCRRFGAVSKTTKTGGTHRGTFSGESRHLSGALDAECVWNLEGALTVADRLDEYMLVNNVSSDSELGIYLVNKGITPFPDRFKPYINYARVGAEYREKHGGEYSSGNYVQKKTPELFGEREIGRRFPDMDGKPPALFVYRAKQRRSLCLRPLSNWRAPDNFWEWTASIWRNSLGWRPCGLIWGISSSPGGWI